MAQSFCGLNIMQDILGTLEYKIKQTLCVYIYIYIYGMLRRSLVSIATERLIMIVTLINVEHI